MVAPPLTLPGATIGPCADPFIAARPSACVFFIEVDGKEATARRLVIDLIN